MTLASRRKPHTVVICWALCVLCMALIFIMSAQDATKSEETSGEIIRFVLRIFRHDFDSMTAEEQQAMVDSFQHVARKTAHFSAYAMLGLLFTQGFFCFTDTPGIVIPSALICSAFYAGTDEIHQKFVPGRSGEVRDVFIDCCGALLGVAVSFGVTFIVQKVKRKRSEAGD